MRSSPGLTRIQDDKLHKQALHQKGRSQLQGLELCDWLLQGLHQDEELHCRWAGGGYGSWSNVAVCE